jgi:hypothetical protein
VAVVLRVVVYCVLGPTGNDDHYEVIESILREGRLPMAGQYAQAFHPPAYYLLSLPWAMVGGPRFVEIFSLLLSIANTWLLFGLLGKQEFIASDRARLHAMALTAFLPQFVVFSILVSNDSLSMLAGTLALLAALRFQSDPSVSNAAIAGLVAALGLLTKGTLIAHAGVLLFIVAIVSWQRLTLRRGAVCVAVFLALTLSLGSYKFIENEVRYGRPFIHNMDFGQAWVEAQRPTITGFRSLIDVDIVKLLREPYGERREGGWTNPQSVPLLLYATLWHPYVPVSNFRGTWQWTALLAQVTYLITIPATLLIASGWIIAARRPGVWIPLAFFAADLAIVLAAGVKYDAWSCFQSRLLFPSFAAIAFGYAWGIEALSALPRATRKGAALARFADVASLALYAAFLTYFTIEIGHVVMKTLG